MIKIRAGLGKPDPFWCITWSIKPLNISVQLPSQKLVQAQSKTILQPIKLISTKTQKKISIQLTFKQIKLLQ